MVNFGNDSYTSSGIPTARLYGLRGAAIDTSRPFHVSVTFDDEGVWSTTLSQDGRIVPHFNASAASVNDVCVIEQCLGAVLVHSSLRRFHMHPCFLGSVRFCT